MIVPERKESLLLQTTGESITIDQSCTNDFRESAVLASMRRLQAVPGARAWGGLRREAEIEVDDRLSSAITTDVSDGVAW